ncbi:hypothetical protein N566_15070 [Streptomycetaceae bacterium MP113-05]|nr:hypothetical protein N566_15070 [Streptomycetaceae bacterium MP113-05]
MRAEAWEPYPDAHGPDGFVQAYVLSYEQAVQKPESRIFRIACATLGVEPEEVLMVGDGHRADGGAAAVGCACHPVDHLPVEQRPHGPRPLLDLLGPA